MPSLRGFAAQAKHEARGDVRMPGKSGQCAIQQMMVLTVVRERTAALVDDRDDTINVRVSAQVRLHEFLRYIAGGRR